MDLQLGRVETWTTVSRVIDGELDRLLRDLPAVAVEGPKGVGKTATAMRRATRTIRLDYPDEVELMRADPSITGSAVPTLLIDEWQRYPPVWDEVRRAVDEGAAGGSYLLTGSAAPAGAPVHSGAGRIVSLRMRPLSLAERALGDWCLIDVVALQTNDADGETTLTVPRAALDLLAQILGT